MTEAAFASKWGETNFPSNGLRQITGAKLREFVADVVATFQGENGAVAVTSWKDPVRLATTANITLTGEQSIDGAMTSTTRVLVKDQTTTSQNGIYVSGSGAWTRDTDSDLAAELEGAAVSVLEGSVNKNRLYIQTSDNITLGTTAIVWEQQGFNAALDILIDEDNMVSNLDSKAPTQQSVKAYVDSSVAGIVNVLKTVVNISSAEILNLFSAPKTLIAAPGAGKVIRVIDLTAIYTYATAAYATNTTLGFSYNVTGNAIPSPGTNTMLAQTSNQIFMTGGFIGQTALTAAVNLPLVASVSGGNPTAGSGTVKVTVTYQIIDM